MSRQTNPRSNNGVQENESNEIDNFITQLITSGINGIDKSYIQTIIDKQTKRCLNEINSKNPIIIPMLVTLQFLYMVKDKSANAPSIMNIFMGKMDPLTTIFISSAQNSILEQARKMYISALGTNR